MRRFCPTAFLISRKKATFCAYLTTILKKINQLDIIQGAILLWKELKFVQYNFRLLKKSSNRRADLEAMKMQLVFYIRLNESPKYSRISDVILIASHRKAICQTKDNIPKIYRK